MYNDFLNLTWDTILLKFYEKCLQTRRVFRPYFNENNYADLLFIFKFFHWLRNPVIP